MISVEEALARLLALAPPLPAEPVALAEAAGRVMLAPAIAARAQPPFAAAAMDGWAVPAADAQPGARLRILGVARAGEGFGGRVGPGEAVRIFTGAPIPEGVGHVVIQEDARAEGGFVVLREVDTPNIRAAGADFPAGHRLEAPRRLRPAELALLAAMNVPEVQAARRPEVAVIATGDELVMPGEAPGPDQIVASNLFAIKALAEAEGARVRLLPIARDELSCLEMVLDLASGADVVVTIGGASVGDHDLVGQVAAARGMERAFWKIAMRPGKPLMAGRMDEALLLGLPGNPVSAIVCGYLFLCPVLRALQGLSDVSHDLRKGVAGCDLPANGPRAHYLRARLEGGQDGPPRVIPARSQDSALLTVLADAAALLIRPPGAPALPEGAEVGYIRL